MTYIALDNKVDCYGIYKNGQLFFDDLPIEEGEWTWKYTPNVPVDNTKYAYLVSGGRELEDVCPESLRPRWDTVNKKMRAFMQSFVEAKINLSDNCFYDLVPKRFLMEYCELKCQIVDSIVSDVTPENYDQLVRVDKLLSEISSRELSLELDAIGKLPSPDAQRFHRKVKKLDPFVRYNQFGTKTGRLSTKKGSFPILNMPKKFRSIIKPQNSVFLELDYNAAELRVLLALSGQDQPQEDVHAWNAERMGVSREEAKVDFFAWLYGSTHVDGSFFIERYNIEPMLEKLGTGDTITTVFGRTIEADDKHRMNYMMQSTTSDMVLEQVCRLNDLLTNTKSYVSFLVHDSVVIDLDIEEQDLIKELVEAFRDTRLGNFKTNISLGKDYGNMEKVEM